MADPISADASIDKPDARLRQLDVLRGFALLGILLVNFEWFSRSTQAMLLGSGSDLAGVDAAAGWLILWLAESKFFPLFSMLFGMGFAVMSVRARTDGRPFLAMYVRRLLALAVFGALHISLVWSGDILLLYAVVAFIMLLLFRTTPTHRLYKWAIVCWMLPVTLTVLSSAAFTLMPEGHAIRMETAAELEGDYQALLERVEDGERIHRFGTFQENIVQRWRDMGELFVHVTYFWIPMILGFFLFGRWLIESGIITRPDAHQRRLFRWQAWGLAAGLPAAWIAIPLMRDVHFNLPDWRLAAGLTLYVVGSISLSLAYLAMITRYSHRLTFLAPVGRLALSNYLLQTIFWTTLFYGYGGGLWGQIPRAWHIPLSILFFAVQVVLSRWWLLRYRHGPAEWVWRALTFGRRPT